MTLVGHSVLKTGRYFGPRSEGLRIQAKCRILPRLRLSRKSPPPFIPPRSLFPPMHSSPPRLEARIASAARALAPDLESKSGLARYLFNNIVGSFSPFPGPSSGSVTLAFHRRFSIAERVPRRETDETFETHFPPSAPVGRSAVFGGFARKKAEILHRALSERPSTWPVDRVALQVLEITLSYSRAICSTRNRPRTFSTPSAWARTFK